MNVVCLGVLTAKACSAMIAAAVVLLSVTLLWLAMEWSRHRPVPTLAVVLQRQALPLVSPTNAGRLSIGRRVSAPSRAPPTFFLRSVLIARFLNRE